MITCDKDGFFDMEPLKALLKEYTGLLRDGLLEEYRARTNDLEVERKALESEIDALSKDEGERETILAAKVRILERERDELIVAGKPEEIAKKEAELETEKQNLEALSHRGEWIFTRLERIEQEKISQATAAVRACYPAMRYFCLMLLDLTFDSMAEVKRTLVNFGDSNGATINQQQHLGALRPYDVLEQGRHIWEKVCDVFPEVRG